MNIVNICCYAEGYYSGQTYEENIELPEDIYEKVKEDIDELEIYISELDGKYSEVEADIEAQFFSEKEIPNAGFGKRYDDGDSLWYKLEVIFDNKGLNLWEENRRAKNYIDSVDYFVDVTVKVKRSDVHKIEKYAKQLYE